MTGLYSCAANIGVSSAMHLCQSCKQLVTVKLSTCHHWCYVLSFSAPVTALHLAFKAQHMHHNTNQPPLSVVMQLCSLASDSLKTCEQTMSSEDTLHQVSWLDTIQPWEATLVSSFLAHITYSSLVSCWPVIGCCVCATRYGSPVLAVSWNQVHLKNKLHDSFARVTVRMLIHWLVWWHYYQPRFTEWVQGIACWYCHGWCVEFTVIEWHIISRVQFCAILGCFTIVANGKCVLLCCIVTSIHYRILRYSEHQSKVTFLEEVVKTSWQDQASLERATRQKKCVPKWAKGKYEEFYN